MRTRASPITSSLVFSGIVQGICTVRALERGRESARLVLELGSDLSQGLQVGASVAVDGVCLTTIDHDAGRAEFDVVAETLRLTTLGRLSAGSRVNVERSLRVGDEIGGHRVSGHVMATGTVLEVQDTEENLSLLIALPASCSRYILYKGFVAIDGCSLTVGEVTDAGFWVHLIPETRRRTTLDSKHLGSEVNIEPDPATVAIVETVERVLAHRGLTADP